MYNTYYQEELAFLREMGREFAAENPKIAHMLEAADADPDVERILQGVSFLTGRLRQKVDDEIPELFQSLMSLLWPHYLRPVPSTTIVQFYPMLEQLTGVARVERETEIESIAVDGTPCKFRTCYPLELAPIEIESATLDMPMATDAQLRIGLRAAGKVPFPNLKFNRVRFFLADEAVRAATLYLWIVRYGKNVQLRNPTTGRGLTLPISAVKPVGFASTEAILPYPPHSFPGYRLLQEYFTCPAKFFFLDVNGLDKLSSLAVTDRCEIVIPFSRRPEDTLRVEKESLRLHCTPVVNLFEHRADGVRVDHTRTQYRIRPSTTGQPPEHYEIYAVGKVVGIVQGEAERRTYPPLHAFEHVGVMTTNPGSDKSVPPEQRGRPRPAIAGESIYYETRLHDAVVGEGTDTYISFVAADEQVRVPPTETISINLTCSNRNLPSRLKIGDVSVATDKSPEFARFRNITPVTRSLRPPLGRGLHWRLISHLSLNYVSLLSIEALRGILKLYNYQEIYDRQAARENLLRLEGLVSIDAKPVERLMRGAPVRGMSIKLEMDESRFAGEGDMFVFATVLNEFFALYASINAMTELQVIGKKFGEVYRWPARLGQQMIL